MSSVLKTAASFTLVVSVLSFAVLSTAVLSEPITEDILDKGPYGKGIRTVEA